MKTLFLDTETTGLSPPKDKIVEVSIVDSDGDVVINSLVNPEREIGFATNIHCISDAMVATAPTLVQLWPKIYDVVQGNHLVIYNAQFDSGFFPNNLSCASKIDCAMIRFASIYGKAHGVKRHQGGNYKWQKLTTAAAHINYKWRGDPHRALADALATRALWIWMEKKSGLRVKFGEDLSTEKKG